MFTNNPFAELSAFIPPAIMKTYVVVMVILVVAGTLFDVLHKRSAKYFFDNWRNGEEQGVETSRRRGNGLSRNPDPLRGGADVCGVLHRATQNRPTS